MLSDTVYCVFLILNSWRCLCAYINTLSGKVFLQNEIYFHREFQQDVFGSIPDHVHAILDEKFRDLLCPPTKVSEVVPHYNIQRTLCHIISGFLLTFLADPQKHQQTLYHPKHYDVTISWLCVHITEHLTTKVNLHFI